MKMNIALKVCKAIIKVVGKKRQSFFYSKILDIIIKLI